MPTLKEYLIHHRIEVTPDQRSELGRLLSGPEDNNGKVLEDGFMVKDYKIEYLDNHETQKRIISYFHKLL
jgi:hypothetical protein